MTFLSKLYGIFDRTLDQLSSKKQFDQMMLKYDEIGIFNKFLSEQFVNMYPNVPDIPPRDMSTSSESLYKTHVMAYLKENKDLEFNIGLGTIKLRRLLEASNGNKALAAYNYNGNKKHDVRQPDKEVREIYRDKVKKYYNSICNHRAEMC